MLPHIKYFMFLGYNKKYFSIYFYLRNVDKIGKLKQGWTFLEQNFIYKIITWSVSVSLLTKCLWLKYKWRVPAKKEEKEEGERLMILDPLTCPPKTDLKGSVERTFWQTVQGMGRWHGDKKQVPICSGGPGRCLNAGWLMEWSQWVITPY